MGNPVDPHGRVILLFIIIHLFKLMLTVVLEMVNVDCLY